MRLGHTGTSYEEPRSASALRVYRAALGLTQAELGARAGRTRKTILRLENGQHRPTAATARALSAALGCEVAELFPDQGDGGEST